MLSTRIFLLLTLTVPCRAFAPVMGSSVATKLASTSDAVTTADDETSGLTFACETVLESESLGTSLSPKDISDFFQQSSSRDCMITAGNQRPVELILNVSPDLFTLWEERCAEAGATAPEQGEDALLKVTTGGINFPGLTLSSQAYIGCKLVQSSGSNEFPSYEFVLIKDEQTVSGLKPAVWIFNSLTGGDKKPPVSFSKVSATNKTDATTVFQFDCQLIIKVDFPKILLKILPVTREKAQAQGSEAITKTLLKDLESALTTLTEQFKNQ